MGHEKLRIMMESLICKFLKKLRKQLLGVYWHIHLGENGRQAIVLELDIHFLFFLFQLFDAGLYFYFGRVPSAFVVS